MNGQMLDLIFLILGVLVMVVALAFARRFEMKPIKISIEKVGSLEMTFVPFLLLIGVMIAGVGQFFRYRNYEERVSHLADLNTQYEQTRTELERFKSYEMMARLVFHDPVDAKNVKADLLYKRWSDPDYHQSDISLGLSESPNELSANIPRVNPGDKFFLIVTQVDPTTKQTHTWKSSSVEVPVARLEMVTTQ
jgi:hypothetical protein